MRQSASFFQHTLRVRYAEVDAQGIVFNAHYLTYIDVSITEYFRHRGQAYAEFVKNNQLDFHVVKVSLEFKQPARFDEEIEVGLQPEYRGAIVAWAVEIRREEELLCSGEIFHAPVDTVSGKPKRIGSDIAELLGFRKSI